MNLSSNLMRSAALGALVVAGVVVMHGCSKDDVVVVPGNNSSVDAAFGTGRFVQVERLGRPVINEGLVITNDFLNAFNAITPEQDLSDAAAPVRTEVVATLNALDSADGADNVDASAIARAFLPDVMRIDTSIAGDLTTAAYSRALNSLGSPIGGRKLEDDVFDITATILIGAPAGDNVPYNRPAAGAGSANPAIGHQLLNSQLVARGAATFPYLAPAN